MFFKQYNYKPRTGSWSSQSSSSVAGSSPKDEMRTTSSETTGPAASAGAAGRRRSSASASDKFAGLMAMKRGSQDERKSSWAEQKPGQSGILSGMWNSYTKGTS
ncbi:uncharacterized protein Z518_04548 [Rhinocladiella mackenziei CBS 650.93]|uniref:Conidiation-specific protein 8 n=1 Tax=Rhinocladiella mackenziei CBS 650.93 TaxID=1442369 RepID=A0A0D2FWJ5_9EURO|nr:uncharacterized protein Z518_04548 [Rhinocladiella mackenziei CBS 650.93]KIX06572.1 hypothetical protein Z518_04548 [Rhinocladiella mackenziei CBS 650.93]